LAAADPVGGRTPRRRSVQARWDEQHAKAARLTVVLSLFLVLLLAALMVGGRAVIDPLLQAAAETREAKRLGEVIYTMPDGQFCRHLSFDNMTADLTEGAVERCAHEQPKKRVPAGVGFAWGAR